MPTLSMITKMRARKKFLNSTVKKVLKSLEIDLKNEFKKLGYMDKKIKDILNFEYDKFLKILKKKKHIENLFVDLQSEIKKMKLDIDLKKYCLFKDFELKRKDKENPI